MHRWQVGDTEIVRVEDLDFALPTDAPVPAWCVPAFAPSVDEVGIAFSALAIAADGLRIVVDPWMANDGPRARPGAEEYARRLLRELGDAGFPPDDVDVVVNTHFDGVGWNTRPEGDGWVPSFPNARYLYPADELAAIDRGEELFRGADFGEVRSVVEIEPVTPPLALTSSVTLDPAPGHNFGHLAVRVESGDDMAVYGGHLFLTPFHVADPESEPTEPDHDRAVETRQQILGELAARHGLLLTTLLGGPGGGRVARDGDGFRLDAQTAG
jgi:glyoxylase-like metal-dependent hydrolase (beta-lactamase superfamily II)